MNKSVIEDREAHSLRGHHLVCLHFYHGEGYDETFIRNLEKVMVRVRTEGALIISGPDDICLSCFHLSGGICVAAPEANEEIRAMDNKALELLGLSPAMTVRWEAIENRIPLLFSTWYNAFCKDCAWREACEKDRSFQLLKAVGCR